MIVFETGFYPYVLTSFRGKGFTEAEYTAFLGLSAAMGKKAQAAGTRHVSITLGGVEMAASERKMVARLMETFPKELMDLNVASYVIVPSPAIRGIITALRWLSPKLKVIEPVASIDDAMTAAAAALRAHGVSVPEMQATGARRWLRAELSRQEKQTA